MEECKIMRIIALFIVFFIAIGTATSKEPIQGCKFKGRYLCGFVYVVGESDSADIKVRISHDSPDIVIKKVDLIGNSSCCGQWIFMKKPESHINYTKVKFVDKDEDFTAIIVEPAPVTNYDYNTPPPEPEPTPPPAPPCDLKHCCLKGIPLYGKVKVVQYNATFRVAITQGQGDLNVCEVPYIPKRCGEWQFVDYSEDFSIEYVTGFEDFTIFFTIGTPGLGKY